MIRALWHVRALHLHFPALLVRPIQRIAEWASSRSLNALAVLYDTDKGVDFHAYTPHYTALFRQRRRERLSLLEIGIKTGASLRMWRRYFPKARIIGIDLRLPEPIPGVEMYKGDQSDAKFLASLPGPFDIVVDDGSHIASHVRASFDALYPHLRSGGWYVIEDLETAYRGPEYEGGMYEGGPPGTPGTAIALLRELQDRVHTASGIRDISELHVFDGIAFIRKP